MCSGGISACVQWAFRGPLGVARFEKVGVVEGCLEVLCNVGDDWVKRCCPIVSSRGLDWRGECVMFGS